MATGSLAEDEAEEERQALARNKFSIHKADDERPISIIRTGSMPEDDPFEINTPVKSRPISTASMRGGSKPNKDPFETSATVIMSSPLFTSPHTAEDDQPRRMKRRFSDMVMSCPS